MTQIQPFIDTYIYPLIGVIILAVTLFGVMLLLELILYLSLETTKRMIKKVRRHVRNKKKRRLHR